VIEKIAVVQGGLLLINSVRTHEVQ